MRVDYVREKLYQAIDCLVGSGSIQQRLIWAGNCMATLRGEDFPPEEQQRFEQLWARLSTHHDADIGSLAASAHQLSDDDASKLGQEIFSIYISLRGGI